MPRITLRVPDALYNALEAQAADEHRPTANMAIRLLSLALGVTATEDLDETTNPKLEGLA